MKFKSIVPYLLSGASFLLSPVAAKSQSIPTTDVLNGTIARFTPNSSSRNLLARAEALDAHFNNYYDAQYCLDEKADVLCEQYIDNMVSAQQRIAPHVGKRDYRNVIRQELPGAPVGLHCVYGQYTQLKRALESTGDTLVIIPKQASTACAAFKQIMSNRYSADNGFEECVFNGKMHESDSAYNAALNAYLARNNVTELTPKPERDRLINKFAKTNFSVGALMAGAMLVVPRTRGNTRKFHMIMLLGRGRIQNGEFIPDENGKYVYTGHNNERVGYLFDTWDTNNVFASNTRQIIRQKYEQEYRKIDNMTVPQLVEFLTSDGKISPEQLQGLGRSILTKMARDKYFQNVIPQQIPNSTKQTLAANTNAPANIWMQQYMQNML